MNERAEFDTERANPASAQLDRCSIAEAFDLFDEQDRQVARAVSDCRAEITAAIEIVVRRLAEGGRLLYVGADTSGRLGVLDAVECPPTFQSDPDQVQGRIAGGLDALVRSIEGAEDSRADGAAAVSDATSTDIVFGIAAGGTTPFVHGALAHARSVGAATIFLACVPRSAAGDEADVSIRVLTGPEVLAGSTRLKAGTATKMVLNRVTTIAMTRLGKVHGNLMVDVDTRANAKLTARGASLVASLTGLGGAAAAELLELADGQVKSAVVMHRFRCSSEQALARLANASGFLRDALEAEPG